MRRAANVVVALGVLLLLGSYVAYTQAVVFKLRHEAELSGRMYARVYRALTDTSADLTAALFDLSNHIRESGVPMILTDPAGQPQFVANLPLDSTVDVHTDPRVREWIAKLDAENPPIVEPNAGTVVHFGHTPLVQGLRYIPAIQAGTIALLLLVGIATLRTRARADRERVWAGMARESAHQLGTPISSISGWVELLRENESDALTTRATTHMAGDVERLQRVANRFERIGLPPKRESVDLVTVSNHVVDYFSARLPSLAHTVTIERSYEDPSVVVAGDAVLIEWAIEALVKNAVDALAGRGGTIRVSSARLPEGAARLRVSDDGPGVPRDLRRRIFDAGFSTKERGWGIGLALAKRIVEETHRGKLTLLPADRGATFEITFPA